MISTYKDAEYGGIVTEDKLLFWKRGYLYDNGEISLGVIVSILGLRINFFEKN